MVGLAVADELIDETHPPIVEFKLSDLQHHVVISVQQQRDEQEPAGNKEETSVYMNTVESWRTYVRLSYSDNRMTNERRIDPCH